MTEHNENMISSQLITIFDADKPPKSIDLSSFNKSVITFGREAGNDIILTSMLVSYEKHGEIVFDGSCWTIKDCESTNGLIYNNEQIGGRCLCDGDLIRIDDGVKTITEGVLFVVSSHNSTNKWDTVSIKDIDEITIGRDDICTVTLSHVSVSNCHAKICKEDDRYVLYDVSNDNGIVVNGKRVTEKTVLHEKDVIVITNSKLIFTSQALFYCSFKGGIAVDASDVVIVRKHKGHKNITCNHVSLNIRPGELVSIIGGSGAGKSTILNALCGYLTPKSGEVYINGVDLYRNFDSLKKIIGYVPQSDIVFDNLTLYDMLVYTAKLRLPRNIEKQKAEDSINRAIAMVELTEKRDSLIKNLSGGQRKRASIAVELLSDPSLLFLDEPASGLDPGTERNLMHSLREMADGGKTVILVTHSTLQLKLCDKIVFMGKGGNLCFCGSYNEALEFFGVSDVVDIYNLITEQSDYWKEKYEGTYAKPKKRETNEKSLSLSKIPRESFWRQLSVLCSRYLKLIFNDKQRLMLLLFQAPILALLISFVANDKQFEQYEMTKSLLFALACSAFWIGMLNAIQEICKERIILKREYMTGLRLDAYILSKIVVLGLLCAVQSLLVTGVFALLVGIPESGVILHPFVELITTTLLTAVASVAMGLFVSALFKNADRAMTVAPILLMPQILFSGLIFKIDGATEILSWAAICRWSMEGYGTTANLNELPLRLQQEGIQIPHEAEDFFTFTNTHMWTTWGILIAFTIAFLVLARIILNYVKKEMK